MRSKWTQLRKRRCHLLLGTDKGVPGIFALCTRAGQIGRMLRAKRENTDMPNERISGNGAVTLWFHVQLLRRAVPECEHWSARRMIKLTIFVLLALTEAAIAQSNIYALRLVAHTPFYQRIFLTTG